MYFTNDHKLIDSGLERDAEIMTVVTQQFTFNFVCLHKLILAWILKMI